MVATAISGFLAPLKDSLRKLVAPVEHKVTPNSLLDAVGMIDDTAYYAGVPADPEYLSAVQLKTLRNKVETEFGVDAATNFVAMVKELPSLAPARFVYSFARLFENEWQWESRLIAPENKVFGFGIGLVVEGLARIHEKSGGADPDRTAEIREDFLSGLPISPPGMLL